MATVDSGSWVGAPSAPNQTQSQRTRVSNQQGQLDALGYIPDDQREKRTGIDPGGGGYVSGQPMPEGTTPTPTTGVARGAYVPPPGTPTPTNLPPQTTSGGYQGGGTTASGTSTAPVSVGGYSGGGAPAPGSTSDTTTIQSGLTSTSGPGLPTGGPTVFGGNSRLPALTSGGSGPTNGTTKGTPGYPVGGSASPTVNILNRLSPGLGDQLDIGSGLLTPHVADVSPLTDATNSATTLGGNLENERYNYRPGAAPTQDRVELDKTNEDQIRQRQLAALGGLNDAANGRVPSAAEIQMRREAAKNTAATLGQARALGGRSAGGVARAGTLASADMLSQNNVAGAQLRASEQERARAAEIAALGGVRGQDTDISQADANLHQMANQNNLTAQTQQNQLAEQHRQALLDAQLKALGLQVDAAGNVVRAGEKNADAENKFTSGVTDIVSKAFV